MTPLLHTEEAAAELLGISADVLKRLRLAGEGPTFVRPTGPTGHPRYRTVDLEAWVAALPTNTPNPRQAPVRHRRSKHDHLEVVGQ